MARRYTKPFALRNLLTAVGAIGVLWATPWVVWVSALPAPAAKRTPFVPQVSYQLGLAVADGSPWSPVTIPLPTQWGYSRVARAGDSNMLAILKPRVMGPSYYERGADAVPAPDYAGVGAAADARAAAFRPERRAPRVFGQLPPAGREGLQVEVYEGLKPRGFVCRALGAVALPETVHAWASIVAVVQTDARGQVRHVFIESPSGIEPLDRAVARALYMGRAAPGGAAAEGRVRITAWRQEETGAGPGSGGTR